MKNIINNNQIATSDIKISPVGIIPEVAVLKAVRPSYQLNSEGKRTDKVEFIRYDCVNPKDFSAFTLKVLSTKEVITAESLEVAEEIVYIKIPVGDVSIKVFKVEYGIATVSIVVPYVQLASKNKEVK